MKYTKFDKSKKYGLNIIFVFEDNLASITRVIDKGSAADDIKMSISNKVITGKSGSRNMLASKLYKNSYYFIGLGNKDELTIQGFEMNLRAALKEINSYKISAISIDLTNLKIKNIDIIRALIICLLYTSDAADES